ncbi:MAG: PHP domain-containing protein [Syntrophomonadaceae bacterium]
MYDLHVHTTASDGILAPTEIIRLAVRCGLTGLAITDHDTLDGIDPARAFIRAEKIKLDFIPGIELNTDYGDDEVHILGYFIADPQGRMADRLAYIRRERWSRAEKIVARLNQLGMDITMDHVQRLAGGRLIGRPHIARALCELGLAASEEDAFDKYIDHGRPAYVRRYKFTPEEAISLIRSAGGISVLAHPGLIRDQAKIGEIINMGIEGLEVYYPEHTPAQVGDLTELARAHRLVITGGSDFHGTGCGSRDRLGVSGIDTLMMESIRRYHQQNK